MFQPITNSLKQLTKPPPKVTSTSTTTDEQPMKSEPDEDDAEISMEDKPGDMYKNALRSIPIKSRDDGVFGLNDEDKRIGDYSYFVNGDTLHIIDHKKEIKTFVIDDYNLWRLLLVQRPKDIGLKMRDITRETLDEYVRIVRELDLVKIAMKDGNYIKNRAKYKLIPKEGHGFLFTDIQPEFLRKKTMIHPSVVVVPSDKKGLLRALIQGVAEMRSGNTSMQNIVVPLAQEAKRLKILPPGLLTPEEMTWVYA